MATNLHALVLHLDGPLRLIGRDGRDHTPRSGKARALLALLGCAPEGRLTRTALRAYLWSDRLEAQAGASLRRLVADMRSAFGPLSYCLMSETGWVGLDRVDVIQPPPTAPERFADDLDGRDPAFRCWLADRRRASAMAADDDRLHLAIDAPRKGAHPAGTIALMDASQRALLFRPGRLWIGEAGPPTGAVRLTATEVAAGDGTLIHLTAVANFALLFSEAVLVPPGDGVAALWSASARLTEALLGPAAIRMRDLSSFDHRRIGNAIDLLLAGDLFVRPELHDALAGFGFMALGLDRSGGPDAMAAARRHAAAGLRAAPGSPVALAAASLVYGNSGDPNLAYMLARQALAGDRRNAPTRYAATTAVARSGDRTGALGRATALDGDRLPGLSAEMIAMTGAIAGARSGATGPALDYARLAWTLAPQSRPAMRFVAALAFREGREDEARGALVALEAAEPGFSPGMMAEPDYPVATLRDAGLLAVAWARHLGGRSATTERRRRGGGG